MDMNLSANLMQDYIHTLEPNESGNKKSNTAGKQNKTGKTTGPNNRSSTDKKVQKVIATSKDSSPDKQEEDSLNDSPTKGNFGKKEKDKTQDGKGQDSPAIPGKGKKQDAQRDDSPTKPGKGKKQDTQGGDESPVKP